MQRTIIGILILGIITLIGLYFYGFHSVKENSYEKGFYHGKDTFKAELASVFNNSSEIFQNYHAHSSNLVNYLFSDRQVTKGEITQLIDSLNSDVLKSLLRYSDCSSSTYTSTINEYNQTKENILDKYQEEILRLDFNNLSFSKLEENANYIIYPLRNSICDLVEILPDGVQQNIANKLLRSNYSFSNEGKELKNTKVITNQYMKDNLCSILREYSIDFLIQDLVKYSRIISYSDKLTADFTYSNEVAEWINIEKELYIPVEDIVKGRGLLGMRSYKVEAEFHAVVDLGVDFKKRFEVYVQKKELFNLDKNKVIIHLNEPEILRVNVQLQQMLNERISEYLFGTEIKDLYNLARAKAKNQTQQNLYEVKNSIAENFRMLYRPILDATGATYDLEIIYH
jgi:hypothetical protein